jgi:hypothetical protein
VRKHVRFVPTREGLRIDLIDNADYSMFALGTTALQSEAAEVIATVAKAVAEMPNQVSIRGHTDSLAFGDARGMDWLVRSQLLLLATMLIYAAIELMNPDMSELARVSLSSEQLLKLQQLNIPTEKFLRFVHHLTYIIVGIATLIYQGWMALYYHRRRAAVAIALDEEFFDALGDRD